MKIQHVVSLSGLGRTTGIAMDSGDDVSLTAHMYDGHALPDVVFRMDLADRETEILRVDPDK